MTSKEFVIWLKGFTEACNDFTATPKQWDRIKEELDKVNDEPKLTGAPTPIGVPYTPQYPLHTDPYNPYKITVGGTGGTSILNTTNPNTSFTQKYPENSTLTYTNGENKKQQLND